jgi:phage terminase large subunit-like protein
LGRAPGEALWPERIPLSELHDRKNSMTTSAFVAQFQMQPELATYGHIFKSGWFPRYDSLPVPNAKPYNPLGRFVTSAFSNAYTQPEDFVKVTALDAAGKLTESGSYSALCTLLSDGQNVYVCEAQRARVDYDGVRRMVVEHVTCWQSDVLLVENEGMGSRIIGSLEGRSLPIQVCDPVKSKIERAAASAPLCEQGRVWLPAFYTPWKEQWEKNCFLSHLAASMTRWTPCRGRYHGYSRFSAPDARAPHSTGRWNRSHCFGKRKKHGLAFAKPCKGHRRGSGYFGTLIVTL